MSGNYLYRPLRDTKRRGQKIDQLFVGGSFGGRRVQSHFQCRAVKSHNFSGRRARLNVNGEPDTPIDGRHGQCGQSRLSTAL
jgi:hypothetical protein